MRKERENEKARWRCMRLGGFEEKLRRVFTPLRVIRGVSSLKIIKSILLISTCDEIN